MRRIRRLTLTGMTMLSALGGCLALTSTPALASNPPEVEGLRFKTSASSASPIAATGVSSEVTRTTAVLTGTVDPNGLPATYYYQYGTGSEYSIATSGSAAGEGSTAVDVPMRIEDLVPDTTYHYRLVAVDQEGFTGYGEDQTFTTSPDGLPIVLTGASGAITPSSASLSGTVDPNGSQTLYAFQIGTDTNYGAQVFGNVGEGSESEPVTLNISGLQPATTYHYRLVATNEAGTSYGADGSFTTAGILDPLATPPLLATPAIAFPTETGVVIKAPAKKKTTKKPKKKPKPKKRKDKKQKRNGQRGKW
jgi:phosphodiesterase/alkaline phosphatase D-like protein